MKLRLRSDSLRLRLSQGEVARLAAGERVEEAVSFAPESSLRWTLAAGDATRALFSGGSADVTVAQADLTAWAEGDAVGIESVQDAGNGRTLRILVEKDFACLKPRENEDDADAYPHPKRNEPDASC